MMSKVSIIPLIIIILIEYRPTTSGNSVHNCENVCELYNRESEKKCTSSVEDCGGCKPLLVTDNKDQENKQYNCHELDIVIPPPLRIEVIEGHNILLNCEFNYDVKCVWLKDGEKINDNKYTYVGEKAQNNQETHVCTLLIKEVDEEDSGQYQCTCRSTSTYNAVKSPITQLIVFKVVVHPQAQINESYSASVLLSCHFNQPVRCDWLFKNKESSTFTLMTISNNLLYIDHSEDLKKDCSIIIEHLSAMVEGDWLCQGKNQEGNLTLQTNAAHLRGYKTIKTTTHVNIYFNETIVDGGKISMLNLKNSGQNVSCVSDPPSSTDALLWTITGTTRNNKEKVIKIEEKESSRYEWNADQLLSYFQSEELLYILVQCECGPSKALVVITNQDGKGEENNSLGLLLGIVLPIGILLSVALPLICCMRKRKQERDITAKKEEEDKTTKMPLNPIDENNKDYLRTLATSQTPLMNNK